MNTDVMVANTKVAHFGNIALAVQSHEPSKTIRALFRSGDAAVKTQVVSYPPPPVIYFPLSVYTGKFEETGESRKYKLIGVQFEEHTWKEWVAVYVEEL